jgi:CheY-like chemotaxis protein
MAIILLIDDEIENLNALKRALGDENPDWVILTAKSEVEGEAILQSQLAGKQPIDVVLTDLVMDNEESGMNIRAPDEDAAATWLARNLVHQ